MPDPVVTVTIPAFRAEHCIVRAVASLLAQDFTDWQAVVVADDGADYRAVLAAAGIDDARIGFATTGRVGAGPAAARNVALDTVSPGIVSPGRAATPLVAPLDADDRYLPGRLARLVPLALNAGAAGDNVQVVDDATGSVIATPMPTGEGTALLDVPGLLALSTPLFLVARRELAGHWDADIRFAEDVVFNCRLVDRLGRVPVSRTPLYEYRVTAGSLTNDAAAGARADAAYGHIARRLAADGLGIAGAETRALLARTIAAKRAMNRAFEAARAAGTATSFQDFARSLAEQGGEPALARFAAAFDEAAEDQAEI